MTVVMFIPGQPRPKGNMRRTRTGTRMYDATQGLDAWMDAIAWAVHRNRAYLDSTVVGPVKVNALFVMPRPRHHWGTGRNKGSVVKRHRTTYWHTTKPDVDKLLRAVFDGLVRAHAVGDDAQFCSVTALKRYVQPGEQVGCHLTLTTLVGEQA